MYTMRGAGCADSDGRASWQPSTDETLDLQHMLSVHDCCAQGLCLKIRVSSGLLKYLYGAANTSMGYRLHGGCVCCVLGVAIQHLWMHLRM